MTLETAAPVVGPQALADGLPSRRMAIAAALGGLAVAAAGLPNSAKAQRPKPLRLLAAQRQWTPPPVQAPAREGLAELPNAKLWYWDTGGRGDPLILMHPATGSSAIWSYQQPVFAKAGFRVIAYSRRGFGRSEPGPRPEDTGSAADDLLALMNLLGVERTHLLGSAAGGFIVPDFALSHPERLLSMIVACSQGGGTEPAYRQRIREITPSPFATMPPSFRELGPSYRAANPAGVAAWEALEHISRAGPRRVTQTPKNALTWANLAKIKTPALIFTGAADLYMPPSLMLEYASHVPNAETAIVSEAGHSAYWEQPDAFNRLVLDFLGRHRSRKG